MAAKTKELGKARIKRKKQVTLPDEVMEALGLKVGGEIRFRATGRRVYIEPVVTLTVPADEAYAFTPEWQAKIERSLKEIKAGKVYAVRADEIPALAEKLKERGEI